MSGLSVGKGSRSAKLSASLQHPWLYSTRSITSRTATPSFTSLPLPRKIHSKVGEGEISREAQGEPLAQNGRSVTKSGVSAASSHNAQSEDALRITRSPIIRKTIGSAASQDHLHSDRFSITRKTKAQTDKSLRPEVSSEVKSWFYHASKFESVDEFPQEFRMENFYLKATCNVHNRFCLTVALHKPETANALDPDTVAELTDLFWYLKSRRAVSGVFITSHESTSAKPRFSSGADRNALAKLERFQDAKAFIQKLTNLFQRIRNLPVPVIALIDGPCIGAALELAASCDIRVATKRATFSMPEVHLGIPSVIEARLLCDIVGWGRARHLMLTGCTWNAKEAYRAGLVTTRFDSNDHMLEWTNTYAQQLSRNRTVYCEQKKLMQQWETLSLRDGVQAGINSFAATFANGKLGSLKFEKKKKETLPTSQEAKDAVEAKEVENTNTEAREQLLTRQNQRITESNSRLPGTSAREGEEDQPQ